MKLDIQTVIDPKALDVAAWGTTKDGNPCLLILVGGRRVVLECSAAEAKEIGCGAIIAGNACVLIQEDKAARMRAVAG